MSKVPNCQPQGCRFPKFQIVSPKALDFQVSPKAPDFQNSKLSAPRFQISQVSNCQPQGSRFPNCQNLENWKSRVLGLKILEFGSFLEVWQRRLQNRAAVDEGREHIRISIHIYATPLLSTRLGLLNRVFGVENLGLEMSQVPVSSSFAWFWPCRQTKSNPTNLLKSIVNPKSQPVSQGQKSWPRLSQSQNESHSPKLTQNHSPSQSQSQRAGHGHSHSPSQTHATIRVMVIYFAQPEAP